jgi:hypothetical protein
VLELALWADFLCVGRLLLAVVLRMLGNLLRLNFEWCLRFKMV